MTESNMADTGSNFSIKQTLSELPKPNPPSFDQFLHRFLKIDQEDTKEIQWLAKYIFKFNPIYIAIDILKKDPVSIQNTIDYLQLLSSKNNPYVGQYQKEVFLKLLKEIQELRSTQSNVIIFYQRSQIRNQNFCVPSQKTREKKKNQQSFQNQVSAMMSKNNFKSKETYKFGNLEQKPAKKISSYFLIWKINQCQQSQRLVRLFQIILQAGFCIPLTIYCVLFVYYNRRTILQPVRSICVGSAVNTQIETLVKDRAKQQQKIRFQALIEGYLDKQFKKTLTETMSEV